MALAGRVVIHLLPLGKIIMFYRLSTSNRRAFRRSFAFLFMAALLVSACQYISKAIPSQTDTPQPAATQSLPANPPLKILVSKSGVYQLDLAALKQAGWKQVDENRLRLFYQGQAQPLWVEGQGGGPRLLFYAQATTSLYTTENRYWLVDGSEPGFLLGREATGASVTPTPAIPAAPVAISLPSDAYQATTRIDENRVYVPQVESGDHWFWGSLPAPRTQEFEVSADAIASGPGQLQLAVWASTEASISPDHHLRLSFNGQIVADDRWDGKGWHILAAELPEGLIHQGSNQVSVEAPGDTGVAADITFLDWIQLSYPRQYLAVDDELEFLDPGGTHNLTGFSGPVSAYDISDPQAAASLNLESPQKNPVVFQGIGGHRYLVIGPHGYLSPVAVLPADLTTDLWKEDQGADYLAIGPSDLLEPLGPLLDWHHSQDLQVAAIPVEAVYDQFGGGLPEPEAIKAFLEYAVQNWKPAPHYVMLVGDATYDPLGYISSPQANRLPTFFVETVFGGETGSDVLFAQLDDDQSPDLAIGRVPAQTADQVRTFVKKTLEYEQTPASGDWQQRVLGVADGQDEIFRSDAQAFLDFFPSPYQTELYAPPAGADNAGEEVIHRLQAGDLLVAYFGHGSVNMWGKDRIFTSEDVSRLKNLDHLPVIINMTCLTGLFTHPKVESLAETLLWDTNGGAVAVLAPTSLTLPDDQSLLSHAFVDALLKDSTAAIGDWLYAARRQVSSDTQGSLDVMETFLLFGDPALHLP
jgi:hypothetical protein